MNIQFLATYGVGVKTDTYFLLMIFYPYGDGKLSSYAHMAVFGMN